MTIKVRRTFAIVAFVLAATLGCGDDVEDTIYGGGNPDSTEADQGESGESEGSDIGETGDNGQGDGDGDGDGDSSDTTDDPCVGQEGKEVNCPCYGNSSCDTGLVCVEEFCAESICGDKIIDPQMNEQCDSDDLDGATCPVEGQLSCTEGCQIDSSNCFDCGDGQIQGPEQCDGNDLGGMICNEDLPDEVKGGAIILGGQLSCTENCEFNISECVIAKCGDNILTPGYEYEIEVEVGEGQFELQLVEEQCEGPQVMEDHCTEDDPGLAYCNSGTCQIVDYCICSVGEDIDCPCGLWSQAWTGGYCPWGLICEVQNEDELPLCVQP